MKNSYTWYKDRLKGEYLEVFDKIELYGQVTNIDYITYEERMMDLVDMFITAQAHKKPVQKIVGMDVEDFCESYFGEYTLTDRLKKLPKQYISFAWLIFIFEIIGFCIQWSEVKDSASFWDLRSDAGAYLVGLFWGFVVIGVIDTIVKPLIFKVKWMTATKHAFFVLAVVIAGFILTADCMPQIEFPMWLSLLGTGGYIIIYYGVTAGLHFKKYGTLRKTKEIDKISFWGKVNEGIEQDLPQILKKRFDKKNARLEKKNKPLITQEEFMQKFRKDVTMDVKGSLFGLIFACGICAYTSISEMVNSGLLNGSVLLLILLIVEMPIMKWMWSGYKQNPKLKVLNKCDELGMNIIEYAQWLEEKMEEEM